MSLHGRRLRFVDQFVKNGFCNATSAAAAAGYADPGNSGMQALSDPDVCLEIERRSAIASSMGQMGLPELLFNLEKIINSSIGAVIEIRDDVPIYDFSEATPDEMQQFSSIEIHEYMEGRGDDAERVRSIKVKQTDRLKAIALYAKLIGAMPDKRIQQTLTVSGVGKQDTSFVPTTVEEATRAYQEMIAGG